MRTQQIFNLLMIIILCLGSLAASPPALASQAETSTPVCGGTGLLCYSY
jgi:hypothetical protein